MVKLALIAILGLAGCCQTPVDTSIDLPPRPVLIDWPQELIDRTPQEAIEIAKANDLALKEYARRLEIRIKIHNDNI